MDITRQSFMSRTAQKPCIGFEEQEKVPRMPQTVDGRIRREHKILLTSTSTTSTFNDGFVTFV